jgi:hypothetical protein
MDKVELERSELSIPSFASERCRAMTTSLVRTLESIPPTDDQAFEDRALACFVVACGELASMRDTRHRDTVVEQLTIVARKLVKANAGTYNPKVTPKPAQGLAQGLMRGLLGGTPKGRAGRPSRQPVVDLSVDPPGLPAVDGPRIVAREDAGETALREIARTETAQTVLAEPIQVEAAQEKMAQDDTGQDKTAQDETTQDETAQNETAQDETKDRTVEDETREGQTAQAETIPVEGADADVESPAALSWDQLEALIKKEVSEIAPDHETTSG